MPKQHNKKTITIKSQGNVSALESRQSSTVVPEYSSIFEAQEKEFKAALTNMTKVLKEHMNKSLKEVYESTNH